MLFTRCHGCHSPQPFLQQFKPLCFECQDRLIPNDRVFETPVQGIEKLFPLYLSISTNHVTLLQWKRTGSIALQKTLFHIAPELLEKIQEDTFDFIIPIPQKSFSTERSGIIPTYEIAQFLKGSTGIRVETRFLKLNSSLKSNELSKKLMRQRTDRHLSENPFICEGILSGERILLVDDFATTGHTLSQAAECILKVQPHLSISAAVLGYRPLL